MFWKYEKFESFTFNRLHTANNANFVFKFPYQYWFNNYQWTHKPIKRTISWTSPETHSILWKNIQFHNSHITFLIRPLNRHIQLMLTRRISSYFYEKCVSVCCVPCLGISGAWLPASQRDKHPPQPHIDILLVCRICCRWSWVWRAGRESLKVHV